MIRILFIFGLLVLVAYLAYLLYRGARSSHRSAYLCPSCEANSPRYCHLPMRPRATFCEDYMPKGGG